MAFGGMGTLSWLMNRDVTSPDPGRLDSYRKNTLHMPSPWQHGALNTVVWDDVFSLAVPTITRAQAVTIPGVTRGRGIIIQLIADKPLVAYRGGDRLETQPNWLFRSPGWQGPARRMAETIDDLIFYGVSLWGTKRGEAPTGGGIRPILEAWHVPFADWDTDEAGRICLIDADGHLIPADESEVILIPGFDEGLLAHATRTLTGAVELEKAWVQRAKNPIPMIELHETVESGIDPDEAQEVVDAWAAARASENGGIAYTPNSIEAKALGQYSPDMFIEARNSSRLDVAAFLQLPGSLLDASTATASLTYVTQEGQASSVDQLTVPYWARPIEDRLSQDDVVARGQTVRFAWAQAYTEAPGPIITSPSGHPAIQDAAQIVGESLGQVTSDALVPTSGGTPA
ncbi:MAG TPA: phage portal protein [Ornithinibacter sp.]|nr:phage portal protein [Ornithinibacter sp.]